MPNVIEGKKSEMRNLFPLITFEFSFHVWVCVCRALHLIHSSRQYQAVCYVIHSIASFIDSFTFCTMFDAYWMRFIPFILHSFT